LLRQPLLRLHPSGPRAPVISNGAKRSEKSLFAFHCKLGADATDEEGFLACARNDGFAPGAVSGNDGLGVGESAAMEKAFHVYILAGKSGVLYTGVTGHLAKRIWQHKEKLVDGFAECWERSTGHWVLTLMFRKTR
jgi:hypothetical protein